jgi:hypothetical protein
MITINVYADNPRHTRDAALSKLSDMVLIDLCEAKKAAAFVWFPANGRELHCSGL